MEPQTLEQVAAVSEAPESPEQPLVVELRAMAAAGRPLSDFAGLAGASLIGADLRGLDLSGCDLQGAELSNCDLRGANLAWAQMQGCTLYGARLDEAELLGAQLGGAVFDTCRAPRAGFSATDCSAASFVGADLVGASFTKSNLRAANFSTANLEGARLRECDLEDADFRRAILRGVDLVDSAAGGAVFESADLRGAQLARLRDYGSASWIGVDLRDVDFCGAYLLRRHVLDQNYLHEFKNRSRVNRVVYAIWWATSDCGRSVTRWALWTLVFAVVFAGAFSLVEMDYGAHPTPISAFYYSVVTLTTLGYGDVLPASTPAQILAMLEVTLGYVALGGLLSIFSNKLARRAD